MFQRRSGARWPAIAAAPLAGAFAAMLALAPAAAQSAGEIRPDEHSAIQVRALQSDLMVAALACDFHQRYNAVVTRYRAELVANGEVLRGMFDRVYGASADDELNRYITVLANWSSSRSVQQGDAFCASAADLYDAVLDLDGEDLAAFLARVTVNAGGR